MKKLIFLSAVLSTIFLSSCENGNDGCVEVKVISELCGTAVLQVVGGTLPDGVANSWTDANDNTYQNVFTTFLDGCDPNYPQQGATFFVKIVDEQPTSDCAVCLALLADAPEEYLHTVISPECGVDSGDL
ncbi:hypothetical protein [Roseivirga sp.]|uniref:hypothetical protein n=1 Tax=Roseivirga sp. TaxID=1964215 RepID=UPI003B518E3C